MDRPSRKTKVVNYCEGKDFDDDEDFACAKAPPSKKAKEDVGQEQRRPTSKSSSQETNSQSMQSEKSRKPLDEKLYERDLEAAITLSLLNNSEGLKDAPNSKDVKDENTDPASLHLSNCSVDAAVLGLDRITSEKRSAASAGRRKAAEVQKTEDEDEDYQPKLTPDAESDEDYSEPAESEEEEFTVKKVSKTKKKEKVTKKDKTTPAPASKRQKQPSKPQSSKPQSPAAPASVRTPPSAKSAAARPASSSAVSAPKPEISPSPAGGRTPKWTPPAQIGKSPAASHTPAAKSPGLRLGLSRLVRVKPLHPSVTSH
ncbi:RAD51-associated protein 1 isoform X2 [Kryptolebias marmoratus]|uniref:RAD51-associated protein 1 isoform X2 n=1 Tax=Kryptolebias marmoratus TaxID=37003 RepID=UPI0007F898F0|nr:RAD51-associated protein 1 isoform X2 [Kryptolebias marmoratus]